MLSRRSTLLTLALAPIFAVPALAGPVDLALFADRIDEIGCARSAHEVGDQGLLSALTTPTNREKTLVAVRAAPYAHAPEDLLVGLVELACGRDPSLAPEAALSLHTIADTLSARELSTREVLIADLRRAEERLKEGCEHTPQSDAAYALEYAMLRLVAVHSESVAGL